MTRLFKTIIINTIILAIFLVIPFTNSISHVSAQGVNNTNVIGIDDKNWKGIYTCVGAKSKDGTVNANDANLEECKISNLMNQVNFSLDLMFKIFVPIATIAIVYAGFKLVTASASQKSEAKRILTNVILGFLFMSGAFGIVKLIINYLADPSYLFFVK
jgi:hypothetical protein